MRVKICWQNRSQGLIALREKDASLTISSLLPEPITNQEVDLVVTSATKVDLAELKKLHLIEYYEVIWEETV